MQSGKIVRPNHSTRARSHFINRKAQGFTLIELIIVIVILGILAVTVAPQFFNFGADARRASLAGLESAVKSSTEMVYARATIEGKVSETATELEMPDGRNIAVIYGYPGQIGTDVDTVTGLITSFLNIDPNEWDYGFITTGSFGARIAPQGLNGEANADGLWTIENCYVEYLIPTAANPKPQITRHEEGC